MASRTMKAAVMHAVGGLEVLKIQQWPIPKPQIGQVLIRVKAVGLNRSEMYTRQGESPDVKFPRILGIEAVGVVEESPGGEFKKDDMVAAAMSGMGRQFDGGYAEYTCVPVNQVQVIKTKLSWELLGALPEMMNTAWGSLFKSLRLEKDDHLLIRGGTTSVGLAAGCDNFGRFNEVCARQRHCMRNGHCWWKMGLRELLPNVVILTSVCLTTFSSTVPLFMATPLEQIAQQVLEGSIKIPIKTFTLDQIAEAHQAMDDSTALAKIVVLV